MILRERTEDTRDLDLGRDPQLGTKAIDTVLVSNFAFKKKFY